MRAGVLPEHGSNPAAPGAGPDDRGGRHVQPASCLVLSRFLPASLGPAPHPPFAGLQLDAGSTGRERVKDALTE